MGKNGPGVPRKEKGQKDFPINSRKTKRVFAWPDASSTEERLRRGKKGGTREEKKPVARICCKRDVGFTTPRWGMEKHSEKGSLQRLQKARSIKESKNIATEKIRHGKRELGSKGGSRHPVEARI